MFSGICPLITCTVLIERWWFLIEIRTVEFASLRERKKIQRYIYIV